MRLPIFCGLKETLRCGSRLGGSRSARRIMPPYLGFSPAAGAWAKAVEPPVAARYTSRMAMTARRNNIPGMLRGRIMRTMRHLLSDVIHRALLQPRHNQLVHRMSIGKSNGLFHRLRAP